MTAPTPASSAPEPTQADRELAARICSDVGFLADAEPYRTAKVAAAIAGELDKTKGLPS